VRSTSSTTPGSKVRRQRTLLALSVAVALLVPAAIAWACNPQAHITAACGTPNACTQFAPGQSMTVHGSYFPGNASITITGPTGTKTVQASAGGGFTTSYAAPSAAGDYVMSASRPTGGSAPLSFSVVAPAQQNTPAPTGNAPTTQSPNAPGFNEPSVNRSPQETGSGGGDTPATPNQPSGGNNNTGTPGANTPGTVVNQGGQPVFSGSVGSVPVTTFGTTAATTSDPAGASTGSGRSNDGAASTGGAGSTSEQAASGDLWSGFTSGPTASLTDSAAGAPEGDTGSQFGLGIALLAFGLLALVGGLTAAQARRRKAEARR
jgi:hypothetical protein